MTPDYYAVHVRDAAGVWHAPKGAAGRQLDDAEAVQKGLAAKHGEDNTRIVGVCLQHVGPLSTYLRQQAINAELPIEDVEKWAEYILCSSATYKHMLVRLCEAAVDMTKARQLHLRLELKCKEALLPYAGRVTLTPETLEELRQVCHKVIAAEVPLGTPLPKVELVASTQDSITVSVRAAT